MRLYAGSIKERIADEFGVEGAEGVLVAVDQDRPQSQEGLDLPQLEGQGDQVLGLVVNALVYVLVAGHHDGFEGLDLSFRIVTELMRRGQINQLDVKSTEYLVLFTGIQESQTTPSIRNDLLGHTIFKREILEGENYVMFLQGRHQVAGEHPTDEVDGDEEVDLIATFAAVWVFDVKWAECIDTYSIKYRTLIS